MVTIQRVETKKDLQRFIMFAFTLYKDDKYWVPPLIADQMKFFDKTKNPYYEHSEVELFLAIEDGMMIGRISAHTNTMHNGFHSDKKGFFGFFECIDSPEVASLLFDAAKDWLRGKGCDTMSGPFNFSTNDECGLLVDGFNSIPFVMMTHNHHYYNRLYQQYGFKKAMDLYAWYLVSQGMPKFLEAVGKRMEQSSPFQVRCLDKRNLKRDIETVFTIYQSAWSQNWGFVPMTKKEFDHLVDTLLPLIDPKLVFIATHDGKPAGFSVSIANFNVILQKLGGKKNLISLLKMLYYHRKLNSLRVVTMGVIDEFQGKGLDSLFYYYTWKNGMEKGFHIGEFSWVLETNTMMNKIARHLGAKIHKTYRIYEVSC